MFKLDDKDIKRLERDLKELAARALPFATKQTLNKSAFSAQRAARDNVANKMTTRNRFTMQSIRVEQSKTLNIARQEAVIGSTADYMEVQEFGGIKRAKGRQGVAISTSYSAGQGQGSPRTRLPRKANTLASIRLKRRSKGTSRRQRNLVAIKEAAASSNKFIFLDLGKTKGLFRVVGGKRKPKIKMVHDMSRKTVAIPRTPWLAPAVRTTEKKLPTFYRQALEFQLRRHRLLGR